MRIRNKWNKALFTLLFIAALLALAFGQELVSQRGDIELKPDWTLLSKSVDCAKVLKNTPTLEFVERRGTLVRRQIELCVLNIETGDLIIKRYWIEEKDVARAQYLTSHYLPNPDNLPRFMPVDIDDDYEITTVLWNAWNTHWTIETPDGEGDKLVVVGDKYLLTNSRIAYGEERIGKKYSDIVYVPYSEGVHSDEIIDRGLAYLEALVNDVFEDL